MEILSLLSLLSLCLRMLAATCVLILFMCAYMLMCRVCFRVALECWFVLDRNPTESLCGEMLPAARLCPPLSRCLFSPFSSLHHYLCPSTFVYIHDYGCTLFHTFSHSSNSLSSHHTVKDCCHPSFITSKHFLLSVKGDFISMVTQLHKILCAEF